MTKAARVVDSIVQEVQGGHPDGYSFFDCFPAETVLLFIACPDEVETGWYYDGATWVPQAQNESQADELGAGTEQDYHAYINQHKAEGIAFVGRSMDELRNTNLVLSLDKPILPPGDDKQPNESPTQ